MTISFDPVPAWARGFHKPDGAMLPHGELPQLQMIAGGLGAPELIMRPTDYEESLFPPRAGAQLKVDGVGAVYIDGSIYSPEGTPLHMAAHCIDDLDLMSNAGGELVIVGEYVADGGWRATMAEMRRSSGSGTFWAYDAVPYQEWLENRFTQTFDDRQALLGRVAREITSRHVGTLRTFDCAGPDVAAMLAAQAWSEGLEGIVVKDRHAAFKRTRSVASLRWKETVTMDARVLDVTDKGLIVDTPEGELCVGMGFRSGERRWQLAYGKPTIGLYAEIAYNREAGTGAVRHLRFVRWRHDRPR